MPVTQRSSRINKRAFFEDLGYEPHPGQLEIHLATEPRRVVACGVRWGKTLCAAMEGLAAAMEPAERSVGQAPSRSGITCWGSGGRLYTASGK